MKNQLIFDSLSLSPSQMPEVLKFWKIKRGDNLAANTMTNSVSELATQTHTHTRVCYTHT